MKDSGFKRVVKQDDKLIEEISSHASVKTYWKSHKDLETDFKKIPNQKSHCEHWVYLSANKPLYYIILRPLERDSNEKLSTWIEEGELPYYWIDVLSLSKTQGTKEKLAQLLTAWIDLCQGKRGFLADPDVKDEEKVEAFDLAKFKRVGSLIKGEGFFKGSSHHVMRHP